MSEEIDPEVARAQAAEEALEILDDQLWDQAEQALVDEFKKQVGLLLEGAQEDLQLLANDLAQRAITAVRDDDQISLEALANIARMKAEKYALRAKEGAWDLFERIVMVVVESAAAVLTTTLAKKI
ncbi:MAG: hypothetical protein R3F33_11035 [Planctomycetota bacterium]